MAHLSGDEGLIEAFRTGEDLHRFVGARVFHVEPEDVTPGDAQQGQGDELRPRLRAVGVRAVQAAHHLHRRGAGPDGRVLRPVRRGARLPARGRGRGPGHRLHRHDARPAPLPARPHQRQPAAPRGRRADGAQRAHPGVGGRHHQARDEGRRRGADHRGAARRGSCSRCTTSSCSRWRRGSARRSRRWSGARWVRPSRWTCRSTSAWGSVGAGTRRRTRHVARRRVCSGHRAARRRSGRRSHRRRRARPRVGPRDPHQHGEQHGVDGEHQQQQRVPGGHERHDGEHGAKAPQTHHTACRWARASAVCTSSWIIAITVPSSANSHRSGPARRRRPGHRRTQGEARQHEGAGHGHEPDAEHEPQPGEVQVRGAAPAGPSRGRP